MVNVHVAADQNSLLIFIPSQVMRVVYSMIMQIWTLMKRFKFLWIHIFFFFFFKHIFLIKLVVSLETKCTMLYYLIYNHITCRTETALKMSCQTTHNTTRKSKTKQTTIALKMLCQTETTHNTTRKSKTNKTTVDIIWNQDQEDNEWNSFSSNFKLCFIS